MTHDFKGQASKYKLILSSEELGFQHVIWCVCVCGGGSSVHKPNPTEYKAEQALYDDLRPLLLNCLARRLGIKH